MNTQKLNLLAAIVSVFFIRPSAFAQGSLTPPGAPAPTMKSLDQIEPRTPVDAVHTPGDVNAAFIIRQPGSYYLTTNIVGVSGKDGIEIITNNVALDLNGFSLLGVPNANDGGIYIPNGPAPGFIPYSNITVRNGSICGWSNAGSMGVLCFARNASFEHLTLSGNDYGLGCSGNAGGGAVVIKDCAVNGNVHHGIWVAASDCLIIGNTCIGNNTANASGYAGIYVNFGSNNRIEGNHVTGSGSTGNGILIVSNGGVANNIVIRNTVVGGGANNYSFNSSQIVGPLITNSLSGIITNSNPWANFSF